MKVIWFTKGSEEILEERDFGDHTKFFRELRELTLGQLKLPNEVYCAFLQDGETDPCIIVVRSVDDLRIAEGFAKDINVPKIIWMAGLLNSVSNKS